MAGEWNAVYVLNMKKIKERAGVEMRIDRVPDVQDLYGKKLRKAGRDTRARYFIVANIDVYCVVLFHETRGIRKRLRDEAEASAATAAFDKKRKKRKRGRRTEKRKRGIVPR